ncbi:MAG: helix-turn-helix domain-containing protein [Candidatus Sericytochromatia bacterium]|nr:helix-turn-helix domain-containing protein [Candidatus Sericytochromatia bacterium]
MSLVSLGRYPWTGAQFRRAREAAAWSQVELAARAQLFVYEVQKLEAGQKIPPNKFPRLLACLQPYLEKPKRAPVQPAFKPTTQPTPPTRPTPPLHNPD